MKSEISPQLRNFYQELLKWIDLGCPPSVFNKKKALCSTLADIAPELYEEQRILLFKECGSCAFPFNQQDDQARDFTLEHIKGEMYTNPKRLAFIRRHAGE